MGYLFLQTWTWLLLGALLGLFIGWSIWRRAGSGDCSSIQEKLAQCKRRCAELELIHQSSKAAGSEVTAADPATPAPTLLPQPDDADD